LRPPPRLDLVEWADTYRRVSPKNSATPGRWRTALQPAALGPMRAVTEPGVFIVTVVAATQVLKSELLMNTAFYFIHLDPSQSRLGGIVYPSQVNLPANAPPAMRCIVMDDTSATGGMAALPSAPGQQPRITGDYSALGNARQTVWERRTPQGGEAGWGRVAITGTAPFSGCCSRFLIDSTNYLNFANGSGDNINVDTGKAYNAGASTDSASAGVPFAAYLPVRVAQQAAVAAENVNDNCCLYVDYFGYQSRLISSGETTQNSNAWHAIANNQHHSAYGHDILARARVETIVASRPGWITALAA